MKQRSMGEYVLRSLGSGLFAGVVGAFLYVLLAEEKASDSGAILVGVLVFLAFLGLALSEGRDGE